MAGTKRSSPPEFANLLPSQHLLATYKGSPRPPRSIPLEKRPVPMPVASLHHLPFSLSRTHQGALPCRPCATSSIAPPPPPATSPPRRSSYLAGVLTLYHPWWDSRNPVLKFFQKIAILENSYLLVYNSELGDSFCLGSQILCSFCKYIICLCLDL